MDTDELQGVTPEESDTEQAEETQQEEKDWKSEALKYKAMAYKYRLKAQESGKPQKEITKEESPQPTEEDRIWEVAELIRRGYTREDAKFIQNNGGTSALNDANSYVSVALRSIQEQRRAEEEASKVSLGAGQSEVERKFTDEQLRNMSSEELAKILPHAESY